MFDITPEGVKLDASTSGSRRLFAVAALLIVLALGWYFYGGAGSKHTNCSSSALRWPVGMLVSNP
jgi:hypothetical protein